MLFFLQSFKNNNVLIECILHTSFFFLMEKKKPKQPSLAVLKGATSIS